MWYLLHQRPSASPAYIKLSTSYPIVCISLFTGIGFEIVAVFA
ncbi:hypothetical protein ABTG52_11620 [Acinetobacter baumannii]